MLFRAPSGSYKLERIPKTTKGGLRAWDAADELLLNAFFEKYPDKSDKDSRLLLVNDSFGALSLALNAYSIDNCSDSFLSHLATRQNIKNNQLEIDIRYIPSTEKLAQTYHYVLIKIPKTLALLEDQLYRLKANITTETTIIAAAMSKHIHTSTLKIFEQIIGTTTTSRATKKARLIYSQNDKVTKNQSPYPITITDKALKLQLSHHANVFAKNHLDIGTRFFIEQLDQCPQAGQIIDLGCGNGALGIMIQRIQKQAHLVFIDESYMAIASAKYNYQQENKSTKASFLLSNCLDQYSGAKVDLVLCNPPFHQAHSIGDQTAWQMFTQSRDKLIKGGELWVVGNRHLAYHAKLKRLFGNCRTIAANKKFVVLAATRK